MCVRERDVYIACVYALYKLNDALRAKGKEEKRERESDALAVCLPSVGCVRNWSECDRSATWSGVQV